MSYRLGVDIGGTFTDIVLLGPGGELHSKKVLSTPDDYSLAIETGVLELLTEIDVRAGEITEFVHGTTIATNAIIERRGDKVALLTTQGFRDVLELGRFRSPQLYDFKFRKPEPLVERRLRYGVRERILASGEIDKPLDEAGLERIAQDLEAEDVASVAICFINAYVNPVHEERAAAILARRLPGLAISASSQFLPQIQEYERTSTTVVNAYIRPVVARYVDALALRLKRIGVQAPLMIMQSSGGIIPGALAATHPVFIIESGPAAGVVGAQRLGQKLDLGNLLVLDMGGTTAKATIIVDGAFGVSTETEVGGGASLGHRLIQGAGYVVQVPTIDIAEVGAGGGSMAMVDHAGGVRVGPRSAGAVPGPICYDRGGDVPTVTDANLVLGYLNPHELVGGDLSLNFDKAQLALDALAQRLGVPLVDAAYGIHLIANSNMMRALRSVSSERGRDPAQFTLMAIGGNGGVHAVNLAEALRVRRIVVPPAAGLFSALGLLFANVEHHLVSGFYRRLAELTLDDLSNAAAPLIEQAESLLTSEGYAAPAQRALELSLDVKYVGQSSTLPVAVSRCPPGPGALAELSLRFAELHDRTFGYSSKEPLQATALKVVGRGLSDAPRLPAELLRANERPIAQGERKAYFGPEHGWVATPLMSRAAVVATPAAGPCIVEEYDCTVVVRPGWRVHRDGWNNLVIEQDSHA